MEQKFGLPNSERDNPENIEMAYVWTFHEWVERLYQFAHITDDITRREDFKYALSVLQWKIESYLIDAKEK